MPMYTFENDEGQRFSYRLSIADYRAVKAGEKALLDEEDRELKPVFDPGQVGFNMKDGVTGGWPSKTNRERKYRDRHYDEMGRRMKDHAPKTRLVPNHGGQLADKWSDVQDYVHSTKGAASASTYDHLVKSEKTT